MHGQRLCIPNIHQRYKACNKNDNLCFVDFLFFFDVMFSECVQMYFLRNRRKKKKEGGGGWGGGEPEETGFSVFCLEL